MSRALISTPNIGQAARGYFYKYRYEFKRKCVGIAPSENVGQNTRQRTFTIPFGNEWALRMRMGGSLKASKAK
jgi:hypothetical protein